MQKPNDSSRRVANLKVRPTKRRASVTACINTVDALHIPLSVRWQILFILLQCNLTYSNICYRNYGYDNSEGCL